MPTARIYGAAVVGTVGTLIALLIAEPSSEQVAPSWNWEHQFKVVPNASELVAPTSERELIDAVLRAGASDMRLKVVGSGHSWSDIAMPSPRAGRPFVVISTHRYNRAINVDAKRMQVSVQAGMRLRELVALAAAQSPPLALHNMPSIDEQTVAGMLATATHGSGLRFRNLGERRAGVPNLHGWLS